MIREYDIVGILRKLISEMEIKVCVKSSLDNGDGTFTIDTCNTQYINECSILEINGSDYIVESIENNSQVVFTGSPVLDSDFIIKSPLFIPDTPQGANNEIQDRRTELDRHPFIWLLENFPTDYDFSNKLNVAEARVRLFFLDAVQEKSWLEDQHRKNCIEPMVNLCDRFLEELKLKVSGKIERLTITNRIRFGQSNGGKKIIDEHLSGVELDIRIPIKKWAIKCVEC